MRRRKLFGISRASERLYRRKVDDSGAVWTQDSIDQSINILLYQSIVRSVFGVLLEPELSELSNVSILRSLLEGPYASHKVVAYAP